VIEIGEEVGRIAKNLRRAGFAQVGLGKPATEQANRFQSRLAGRFCVIGRVADNNRVLRRKVQPR
jgi:hypothetical protein